MPNPCFEYCCKKLLDRQSTVTMDLVLKLSADWTWSRIKKARGLEGAEFLLAVVDALEKAHENVHYSQISLDKYGTVLARDPGGEEKSN